MTLTLEQYTYAVATQGISILAEQEAVWSYMPGRADGPADAYRHILLAAELTRQFGETYANTLLNNHEFTGNHSLSDPQAPEANAMDLYNNQLGIEIGKRLAENPNASWDDVILETRKLFDPNNNNGDGARWLDNWDPDSNPTDDTPLNIPIPNGDPRLNWPVEWKDGPYYDYPSSLFDKWFKDGVNDLFDFLGDIAFTVNDLWNAAQNWAFPREPLILDLDGDGIETLGINATTHVIFDHDGDGLKTGTGWISADDGLLVFDRNANGTIDNGSELFGDQTLVNGVKATDGFSALAGEDTNADGKFDATDTNFANVRVWQDTNADGISQSSELHTLTELNISSINLTSTATNITTNGNVQIAAGTYTKTDGTTGEAGNLNFAQNGFYREFTDPLPLTEEALALPDMQGSGMVRDLREASTLSAGLTTTLQSMSTTYETHDQMMAKIDTLLSQWAETSSMATSVQLAASNHDVLVYVPTQSSEDFNLYYKMNVDTSSNSSESFSVVTYTEAEQVRYQYLLAEQARITRIISILERFNAETFVSIEDDKATGGTGTFSMTVKDSGSSSGSGAFLSFDPRVFVGLSAAQVSFLDQSYAALKQSVYDSLALQTRLSSYMDAMELTIDENGIRIDDSAMMGMLTTLLHTDPENAMADMLEINQYAGVNFSALGWNGDERVLDILAALDGIYDATAVFAKYGMVIVDGTYMGQSSNETIWGKQRDDVINAGAGADVVYGGEGNDILNADIDGSYQDGAYADTLTGGKGNDTLKGGAGDDTYVFTLGDGADTIYDYDRFNSTNHYYNAGNDTISFGEGIGAGDVIAKVSGNNLILALKEEGKVFEELSDTITITNWYIANNRIENLVFADGTVLNTTNAILGLAATEGDDTIIGTEQALTLDTKGGNDTITVSNSVNNTIHGGLGNDTVTIGSGADTLYGDEGDDVINAGAGADVVYGGEGNDILNADNDLLTGADVAYADTLTGGKGNDTLKGGAGDDTYVFTLGDGADTIYDYDRFNSTNHYYNAGNDTISFGEGIGAGDVIAKVSGNNLILALKEEGKMFEELSDTITITNWYIANNRIENLVFADGTVLNTTNAILGLAATEGDDTIIGTEQALTLDTKGGNDTITVSNSVNNTIHGGLGNDTVTIGSGADTLYGDEGDDVINAGAGADVVYGGEGNDILNADIDGSYQDGAYADTLTGGKGNDTLKGGAGDDTYVFTLGDGADTIYDYDRFNSTNHYYNAGNDTISFGEGIGATDVSIFQNGSNLILSYGANDFITITNQSVANNAIEKFTLADGNFLTSNDLNVIIQSLNSYATANDIAIDTIDSVKANQDLMNIVAGAWHQ